MALAVTASRLLVQRSALKCLSVRGAGDSPAPWNYLWQPGPYPETEDARKAAAKKYGLILEDYNPYPKDSETFCGDYPMLPLEPMEERSGLVNWDYPEYKRNYGEPLHEEWDMYQETRFGPNKNYRYTKWQMFGIQMSIVFSILFTFQLFEGRDSWFHPYSFPKAFRPVLMQQIPGVNCPADQVHYTFEPADEE
jgi:hypothetical protein